MYHNPKSKEIERGYYKEHYYIIKEDKLKSKQYYIYNNHDKLITTLPFKDTTITIIKYE